VVDQNYDYYDYYIDFNIHKVQSLPTLNFVSPLGAFVSDNTLFVLTGPIAGRRMRFSVSPSVGNIRWIQYLGDYRRYDPVIFNTLTFATRFFTQLTIGRDENLLPTYIGQPEFVRGYDRANFYGGYTCDAFLGASDISNSTCATAQLVGTRVAVANEELRFPIIRRFDLGALPIGLPPVDGLIFYDAGLAWNAGQKVSLTKPDNYDYTLQRYVMRSWGFGLRVNLFNLAILRWDYAKPLDRDNKKWNWTFSLGPSF
jgi:outer membrane protein assembly factor BamA